MINAYAAQEAKGELKPFEYDEQVNANDVVVKVTHCGICHSDVHLADGDWGLVFPCVPGHEIIGIVDSVGSNVTQHKPGDKVGVGWQCDSCGECQYCENHTETFCSQNQATAMGHFGGFAEKVVANERFVIPIPESMDSASTAPLLCGGITMFSPLKKYAKKGDKVAIIGIGGLGHMGVQFAAAMGCDVTAISRNSDKEEEAKSFGATRLLTENPEPASFDLVINTAHFTPDMQVYMNSLKPDGTFVQVGASPDPLCVSAMNLIGGNKKLVGSAIGHPSVIKEMIDFAHEHGVKAQIQEMSMEEVNEAMDITRKGQARYRVVLKN